MRKGPKTDAPRANRLDREHSKLGQAKAPCLNGLSVHMSLAIGPEAVACGLQKSHSGCFPSLSFKGWIPPKAILSHVGFLSIARRSLKPVLLADGVKLGAIQARARLEFLENRRSRSKSQFKSAELPSDEGSKTSSGCVLFCEGTFVGRLKGH